MLERTADGGDRVKLVDFGVAKALGNSEQHVTQAGLVVGTPLYMSPEQLAGRTIDGRSDVYAIAVMTFHLLTGQFPFAGSSWDEVVMARLIGPLRALAAVRPDQRWTPELQRVLDRGLAISADERYQTAEEFGRDLRRAADAAGASTVEPGTAARGDGAHCHHQATAATDARDPGPRFVRARLCGRAWRRPTHGDRGRAGRGHPRRRRTLAPRNAPRHDALAGSGDAGLVR